MKALITGGAGFIGSHLLNHLQGLGWEVTVLDDMSTGRFSNVQGPCTAINRSIESADMRDRYSGKPSQLHSLIEETDVVFHLAAIVGVQNVLKRQVSTIETNIDATRRILRSTNWWKKPTIIASSSEVYGNVLRPELSESQELHIPPPTIGRWGYAAAKLVDEFTALAYHKEEGAPFVVARLFNTIGTRQVGDYGMVVPRFIDQALAGKPITVYGDGMQRRSFVWVEDVVRALTQLVTTPAAYGKVVNIGHPQSYSILDLARMIQLQTGLRSPIEHISYMEAFAANFEDIQHRVPNLNLIRELIGYHTTLDLPEMIQSIITSRGIAAHV